MIYQPQPKKLIVKIIKDTPKTGSLLLITETPKNFARSQVISPGLEANIQPGAVIYHAKYGAICIDEVQQIYIVDICDVYCEEINK